MLLEAPLAISFEVLLPAFAKAAGGGTIMAFFSDAVRLSFEMLSFFSFEMLSFFSFEMLSCFSLGSSLI